MQVLKINRQEFSLFCPFTGASLLNEESASLDPIKLPSVKAVWIDEVIDEPQIKCPQLLQVWDRSATSILHADDLSDAMENFLLAQELKSHIAIAFTLEDCAIGCSIWLVLAPPEI